MRSHALCGCVGDIDGLSMDGSGQHRWTSTRRIEGELRPCAELIVLSCEESQERTEGPQVMRAVLRVVLCLSC
jgi:hypothetical protein